MRILIIGEYSGFANNLSRGFKKLGHHSTVITVGDGSKKIPYDPEDILLKSYKDYKLFGYPIRYTWLIRTYLENIKFNKEFVKKNQYDMIYIINSEFIYDGITSTLKRGIDFKNLVIGKLLAPNGKIILSCCGDDPAFNLNSNTLINNPLSISGPMKTFSMLSVVKLYDKVIKRCDLLHATAYAYYHCVNLYLKDKGFKKRLIATYLPYSVPQAYEKNVINGKIVIYHGILRSETKGSPLIIAAMERLQKKYPHEVESVIKEKMPFDEYLKVLQRCNILIDQVAGDGFGMNACNGLARGKVVLCSVTELTTRLMGNEKCPIVNIKNNTEDVFNKLEKFVLNRELIEELSLESRKFAENQLADIQVAGKLLRSIL